MRKTLRRVFLLLLVVMLCLISCGKDKVEEDVAVTTVTETQTVKAEKVAETTGKVKVIINPFRFDGLISPVDSEVVSYKISGTDGTHNFTDSLYNGAEKRTDYTLQSGNWTFFVEGYNASDEKLIVSDAVSVTVRQGETDFAIFDTHPVADGSGSVRVRIDLPSDSDISDILVSIRKQEASDDYDVVGSFKLQKVLSWQTFDKYVGTYNDLDCGNYIVVADFMDADNDIFFSKELGQAVIVDEVVSLYTDEAIINEPRFIIENNEDGTKSVSFAPSEYDTAIYFTDEPEEEIDNTEIHLLGTRYTGPIVVSETTNYRAVAVADNMIVSDVGYSGNVSILTANAPVSDLASGYYPTEQVVYLSTLSENCDIFYTLDGSNPTKNSLLYDGSGIPVSKNTEIRAFTASNDNFFVDSPVAVFNYEISALAPETLLVPGTYAEEQTVFLKNRTEGSNIYYTLDGSVPTLDSELYTEKGIKIYKNTVINAIAGGNGYEPSAMGSFIYKFNTPVVVTGKPSDASVYDNEIFVTLDAKGAAIFYTLDGSMPTVSSSRYSSPIKLDRNTKMNAFALAKGYVESAVAKLDYKFKVSNPYANVENEKIYSIKHKLILKTDTKDAQIFYSVDGSKEEAYSKPLSLSSGKHIIKMRAVKDGWYDSDNLTLIYDTIPTLNTPDISKKSGTYKSNVKVKLTNTGYASTVNADIYYTTDDSVKDDEIVTKGILYGKSSEILIDRSCTLRAVAAGEKFLTSVPASEKYTVVVKDVSCSSIPVDGKDKVYLVEIECDTAGATVYYTVDGSVPDASSNVYTEPFEVEQGVEVQVYATKDGCEPSGVVSYIRKK